MEHTPTPWHRVSTSNKNGRVQIIVMSDPLGGPTFPDAALAPLARVQTLDSLLDEKNAAFIVRAVNSHDDLLSACKRIMACERGVHLPADVVSHAMEAIAKAEGK